RAVGGDRAEREAALFRVRFDLRRLGEKARPSVQNFLIEVAHFDAAFDLARLHHAAGKNGLTALNDVQLAAGQQRNRELERRARVAVFVPVENRRIVDFCRQLIVPLIATIADSLDAEIGAITPTLSVFLSLNGVIVLSQGSDK